MPNTYQSIVHLYNTLNKLIEFDKTNNNNNSNTELLLLIYEKITAIAPILQFIEDNKQQIYTEYNNKRTQLLNQYSAKNEDGSNKMVFREIVLRSFHDITPEDHSLISKELNKLKSYMSDFLPQEIDKSFSFTLTPFPNHIILNSLPQGIFDALLYFNLIDNTSLDPKNKYTYNV
jgi:hypothetical protein